MLISTQIGSSSPLEVALGEKIAVLMVSVFLSLWHGAIMILHSRAEDVGMDQYETADLPKPLEIMSWCHQLRQLRAGS